MEIESFISGYCRTVDGSRTVCVITENGQLTEVDCSYDSCPYTGNCTVAQQISQLIMDN